MNNLFSTFDPVSWFQLNLNWISALLFLSLIPTQFWVCQTQSLTIFKLLILRVLKEFKAILLPSSPGILLVPLALFSFILVNNALGLIPYIFTASSHLSFTISLALPLWLGHMSLACLKTPTSVLAHLVPLGTPPALIPLIVVIEIVRSLIRPLTLSVRLAANIIAGHLLLTLLGNQAFALSPFLLRGLLVGLILLGVLECAVRTIQAYVFRVLSTLYLNEVNAPALDE